MPFADFVIRKSNQKIFYINDLYISGLHTFLITFLKNGNLGHKPAKVSCCCPIDFHRTTHLAVAYLNKRRVLLCFQCLILAGLCDRCFPRLKCCTRKRNPANGMRGKIGMLKERGGEMQHSGFETRKARGQNLENSFFLSCLQGSPNIFHCFLNLLTKTACTIKLGFIYFFTPKDCVFQK